MKKIKDLVIGESTSIALLVKSAEIRYTKPPGNKPYLSVDLTDGTDTISGNNWDFGNNTPPARNAIVNVTAVVSEWQGNKQLNIKMLSINTELDSSAFAPTGDVNIDQYSEMLSNMIQEISHPLIRSIVDQAFNDYWDEWHKLPAAKSVHHAYVGALLKHSVDVARKAKVIAEITPEVNIDLVVGGALIHDMGKLWTYVLDGAVIDFTEEGNLLEHMAIGIKRTEKYRTEENSKVLDMLQHIIGSHHGKLEYGAVMTPKFMEAWIVSAADGIDAKCETILDANRKANPDDIYTAKVYSLENRQMFTQAHVRRVLNA